MTALDGGQAARIAAIETAFVTHWSHFGRFPGAELREDDGVLWYETPIPHLPYNAVIRSHVPPGADADAVVARVTGRFRERGVPYLWVVRPNDTPADLGRRLAAQGLDLVESATGMDLDLDGWEPEPAPPGVTIAEPVTEQGLAHYEALIRTYWSVPEESQEHIERLNRHWTGERDPGFRLVAYVDGEPVGKLIANLLDLPVAAVYGVAVLPAARGRRVATALMNEAVSRMVAAGARRVVLHSSPMAHAMYRRMGFVDRCGFEIYATAPIFGTHHH